MKTLLGFLFSIFLMSPCFSQVDLLPAFQDELIITNDRGYLNNSPFTGVMAERKTNKKLGEFKNGYKNGLFTEYLPNGKKSFEGKFNMGIKDGMHTEWYENGNKKSETNYKNGVYNGLKTIWFENGQKRSSYNCSNGDIVDGVYIVFFENGQKEKEQTIAKGVISKEMIYENGVVVSTKEIQTEYFGSGQKKSQYYLVNGKKEGAFTEWFENGQKDREGNYANGILNGLCTSWNSNGKKSSEENYSNGKKNGECTYWNNYGQMTSKGSYIDDLENGKFVILDDNLKEITVQYKDGVIEYNYDNLVTNFETNGNSYLFCTPERDKVFVRFDFNISNRDSYITSVIGVIEKNLANSARLSQITNVDLYANKGINLFIECTNIQVEFGTFTCKDSKGNTITAYNSTVKVSLNIKNDKGSTLDAQTYTNTTKAIIFATCYLSPQAAFNEAINTNFISGFINEHLPIKTVINAVEDVSKTGDAETVSLIGGTNIGILAPGPFNPFQQKFKVYEADGGASIGLIKVKKAAIESATCKVIEGGAVIAAKMKQGIKLKVVSTNDN